MNVMQGDLRSEAHASNHDRSEDVPFEVQEAIRTLLRWSGEDPEREGPGDTPSRVGRAWRELCLGYRDDPAAYLKRTFEEVSADNEIVVLGGISFRSHCEHHRAPITCTASIAYLPTDRVVGISKLARVLHGFARRLQVQERLTAQIAQCIWDVLEPLGVAVVIKASQGGMSDRDVRTHGVDMVTSRMLGCFGNDASSRRKVFTLMDWS